MKERKVLKRRLIISLIMSSVMVLSMFSSFGLDKTGYSSYGTAEAEVNITAQADGEFLCGPQVNITVSGDTAEKYGYTDSVQGGVSVLDALVRLHEIIYGEDFTEDTAGEYLKINSYGGTSMTFGFEGRFSGFAHNGAYPNDGTESEWGGYNGTVESTQEIKDGDSVEFFIYSDDWSDEIAWFEYKGNYVSEITAVPGSALKLNLKSLTFMMGYLYPDSEAVHAAGSASAGARTAWINTATGEKTDTESKASDINGDTDIILPDTEGTYYLTAYMPQDSTGNPIIMPLLKITADKDAPQAEPCALSSLSVASFDSNPNALTLSPSFDGEITEYSVPAVDYPSSDLPVFRSLYVKAAAESDEAVIKAECGGVSADITSGDSGWKMLSGALEPGKNNILKITVSASSEENAVKRTYYVKIPMKDSSSGIPADFEYPDRVTDYLCMGSQYTNNGTYGANPEEILTGSTKSLGNFGGYITFYYEKPVTDSPYNKYGMDFYIIGNAFSDNGDSASEPGQVYVSEDGEQWYALAGSEHYEENTLWDYTITYSKGEDGKSYWTDNYGNSCLENAAALWPDEKVYSLNDTANLSIYKYKGILLKSRDGSITGDGTADSNAAETAFGYVDCYASNISGGILTDVNPYVKNPSKANGFDLAWAVDENGIPVEVKDKEFHYIRIASASNIYAGMFGEKSTEVSCAAITVPQESETGKTPMPEGVEISDGSETVSVSFDQENRIYPVNTGDMKYVSIKISGAEAGDNIYINNQRIEPDKAASGFKVTKEKGEIPVRIIIQNGDKEPAVCLLKLTGNSSEADSLIKGIKINAEGTVREATTADGATYNASAGYRIDSVKIIPEITPGVSYTVNGEAPAESYSLNYGENLFHISAEAPDGSVQAFTLNVKRDNPPAQTGNTIEVRFALYGDELHGESEVHVWKENRNDMPVWIQEKKYTLGAGSTVMDLLEKALNEAGISYKKDGINYVSEINGLAQFENGSNSGWMYLYNGRYSNLGAAEQIVRNGDRIIFHYTDDYTKEENQADWGTVSPAGKPDNEDGETEVTENVKVFDDVEKNSWYEDAVYYVVKNSLFKGVSENEFMPEGKMTRAMFAEVLYRLDRPENSPGNSSFEDVNKGDWYYDAVVWAAENGIVKGISVTEFAPDAYITREQAAAVFFRYASFKGWDTDKSADLSGFKDNADVHDWAEDAVKWAFALGLIKGTGDANISPSDTATRAQTAALFMRLCENIIPA
ncbi:MAG: S-layer homology domain-containing protein [Bacillota bacterium]|nr:S-layer homology domain-containing protein [Bacillota bacterium]